MNKALQRAIDHAGDVRSLAATLGLLPQHINNWKSRGVPAPWCLPLEEASEGKASRHDLRPDIFGPAPKALKRKAA